MMWIVYNRIGIAMVLAGCVVALGAMKLYVSDTPGIPLIAIGVVWVVGDVVYRLRWGGQRLFHWRHGGQLYYIPMWALGLVLLGGGIRAATMGIQSTRPLPAPAIQKGPASTQTSSDDGR